MGYPTRFTIRNIHPALSAAAEWPNEAQCLLRGAALRFSTRALPYAARVQPNHHAALDQPPILQKERSEAPLVSANQVGRGDRTG